MLLTARFLVLGAALRLVIERASESTCATEVARWEDRATLEGLPEGVYTLRVDQPVPDPRLAEWRSETVLEREIEVE